MGLDMYLGKMRKVEGYTFNEIKNIDLNNLQENNKLLKKLLTLGVAIEHKGTNWSYYNFTEEVGYWRKANSIHNWFVENVQGGVDDCGFYRVPKEYLEDLLDICKRVLKKTKLVSGKVNNGYIITENGVKENIIENGKVVKDSSVAEMLLPSTDGFFFGSSDYDEWYVEDVKQTIEILEKVLKETDFNNYQITYQASW